MRVACEYCGNEFEVTGENVKKEQREIKPMAEIFAEIVTGTQLKGNGWQYFCVCPRCDKKVGKFSGYLLFG